MRESLDIENNPSGMVDDSLLDWLCDQPLDVIGKATAKVIGEDRVSELAKAAEASGEYYVAACRWLAAGTVANILRGKMAYLELSHKCMDCLNKLQHIDGDDPEGRFTKDAKDHLETDAVRNIVMGLDRDDIDSVAERLQYLLGAQATLARPDDAVALLFFQKCMPAVLDGKTLELAEKFIYVVCPYLVKNGMFGSPDKSTRDFCGAIFVMIAALYFDMGMLAKNFDWDATFGTAGEFLRMGYEAWEYDRFHNKIIEWCNGDYYTCGAGIIGPILLHYGDVATAHGAADQGLENMRSLLNEPNQAPEAVGKMIYFGGHKVFLMHLMGRDYDMAKLMAETGATWAGAEAFVQQDGTENYVTKLGDTEATAFLKGEAVMWAIMIGNILVSERGHVPKSEILSKIPTAEQFAEWIASMSNGCYNIFAEPLLTTALVCESLGQYDTALSYVATSLELPHEHGGDVKPMSRVLANCIRGRVLGARGQSMAAQAAFETAHEEADRHELFLLSALAMSDRLREGGLGEMEAKKLRALYDATLSKLAASPQMLESVGLRQS